MKVIVHTHEGIIVRNRFLQGGEGGGLEVCRRSNKGDGDEKSRSCSTSSRRRN